MSSQLSPEKSYQLTSSQYNELISFVRDAKKYIKDVSTKSDQYINKIDQFLSSINNQKVEE